ncbi:MAG TPA: succinylglutamate desuccinylase/aspartoacylase family protein [Xanthomonadaceae bacterium]|nr:succinylglutamate desuccinylase/aspartoacylase family protein [Xanthomonadaceae bacterium]
MIKRMAAIGALLLASSSGNGSGEQPGERFGFETDAAAPVATDSVFVPTQGGMATSDRHEDPVAVDDPPGEGSDELRERDPDEVVDEAANMRSDVGQDRTPEVPRTPEPEDASAETMPPDGAPDDSDARWLLFISEFDPEFVGPPTGAKASRSVLRMLGEEIEPGQRRHLSWKISESFSGEALSTPVLVVHGVNPGPRLCMTAAVHGDELNGVEIVRRVMKDVDEKRLAGVVIGVPIVNLFGFSRGSRYLPDRRDLNRFFPGSPTGSVASRIAYSLFNGIIYGCDALVDIHTGSFDRSNLPQIRGDLTIPSVLELTRSFGATAVLHTPGERGMLRRAATDRGIPAVTFEVGSPLRLEPDEIAQGVAAIQTLMQRMGMTPRRRGTRNEPQPFYYESRWIRATGGGMLFSDVRLGDRVRPGQRLGHIIDPLREQERDIVSPVRGRIIGMAQNQVVLPGFAAYHIGVEASEEQVVEEAQSQRSLDYDGPPPEHDRMEPAMGDPRDDRDDYGPPYLEGDEPDDEDGADPPPDAGGEAGTPTA